MKRKHLALLLAVAMTVTSLDGTVAFASSEGFSSEPVAAEETVEQQKEEALLSEEETEIVDGFEADLDAEDGFAFDDGNSELEFFAGESEPQAEDSGDSESSLSVQSISLNVEKNRPTAGFDTIWDVYSSSSLRITYTDGQEEDYDFDSNWNGEAVTDSYGNRFIPVWTKDHSAASFEADEYGEYFSEGTYLLQFRTEEEQQIFSEAVSIEAIAPESSESYIGELSEGVNEDLDRQYGWDIFKFIAPSSGKWEFIDIDEDYYQDSLRIKKRNEDGTYTSVESSGNVCELEEGSVYYCIFYTGACKIGVWKIEENTPSVTVNMENAKTSFILGLDYGYLPGASLTVTYEDGETEALEFRNKERVIDSRNNQYSYRFYGKDEVEGCEYGPGSSFEQVGSYDVVFRQNGQELEGRYPIEVINLDLEKIPELSEGVNPDLTFTSPVWYQFKVEKAGSYSVRIQDVNGNEYGAPDCDWKKLDENNNVTDEWIEDIAYGTYRLEEGTYLVSLDCSKYGIEHGSVEISKSAEVEKVELLSWEPEELSFIEKIQEPYLDWLNVKVTYDNGEEREISLNDEDDFGNYVSYTFCKKEEDGSYQEIEEWSEATEGDYCFRVTFRNVQADQDIPVRIQSLKSMTDGEFDSEKPEMELDYNKTLFLKYTAKEAGRYEIASNVRVSDLSIYTAENEDVAVDYMNDYHYYADLKENTEYYLSLDAIKNCDRLKISVSPCKIPEKLKVNVLKSSYVAETDVFASKDLETEIYYSDGSSAVISGNGQRICGHHLSYYAEKEEDRIGGDEDGTLTAGTWTIGLDLEGWEIPVDTAQITVEPLDLKKFTSLSLDQWTDIPNIYGKETFYTFTPEETGIYNCELQNENGTVAFYVYEGDRYSELGTEEVKLDKGKTYLVKTVTYEAQQLRISGNVIGEPEQVGELSLVPGMKKMVSVGKDFFDEYDEEMYYYIKGTFTPEESTYYTIWSESIGNGYVSAFVNLLDENEHLLGQGNANYNKKGNFSLISRLNAGETYEYRILVRNSGRSFILGFDKQAPYSIENAELVPVENVNTEDLSMADPIRKFYQLKLTYQKEETDGSGTHKLTAVYNLPDISDGVEDLEDKYGNLITVLHEETDSIENDFKYTLTVNASDKTYKLTVPVKGVNSLRKMEANKKYTFKTIYEHYTFVPSETGEYILSCTDNVGLRIGLPQGSYGGYFSSMNAKYSSEEGTSAFSVVLEKGKTYVISKYRIKEQEDGSFSICKKEKEMNGLKLVSAPENTICMPFETEAVSLKGLVVEASYKDGSTEKLQYGQKDSSGREIRLDGITYVDGNTRRVSVSVGKYTTSFTLRSGKWSNLESIHTSETKTLSDAVPGDTIALGYVPESTGIYRLQVTGGAIKNAILTEHGKEIPYWNGKCYLEEGENYYIRIQAEASQVQVTINGDGCVHSWSQWKEVSPTCEQDGFRTRICEQCQEQKSEILPATGHTWGSTQIVESTESENGKEYQICETCGKEKVIKILPLQATAEMLKKTQEALDEIEESTAEEEKAEKISRVVEDLTGVENKELLKDESALEMISKVEEKVLEHTTVAATLVENQNTEGISVSKNVKGAALTAAVNKDLSEAEGKEIAAKITINDVSEEIRNSYKEQYGDNVLAVDIILSVVDKNTQEPIAEETKNVQPAAPIQMQMELPEQYRDQKIVLLHNHNGEVEELSYTREGQMITFTIASLSDVIVQPVCTEHQFDQGSVTLEPTCTKLGVYTRTCTICKTKETKSISPKAHNYQKDEAASKEATCTEDGAIVYRCTVCQDTDSKTLPALTHIWSEWTTKNPTCTANGSKERHCTREGCGAKETEVLKALGHTMSAWTTKNPTCTVNGSKERHCTRPGCTVKETQILPATGHKMSDWKITKEATAVSEGTKERSCLVCGGAKETASIGKIKATVTLNVPVNKTLPMKMKQTFQVKATGLAKGDKVVSWVSSNKKIATVSKTGKVSALKKTGTTTITVKLASGLSAKFKVKVQKKNVATTSLSVVNKSTGKKMPKSISLKVKKKISLKATVAPVTSKQGITYSSSNKKVATVSKKGVITAKKKGTATITVKSGKKTVKIKVKVIK